MGKMELLAPAGNMDCLIAAANAGADAVYFAGRLFGARSYAENFSEDEICRAVDFCHIHGMKSYITVNTLILDSETDSAMKYLEFLSNIGTDAVIVQDLGIVKLIRDNFPDFPIHGSTQMTVHNASGVKFLEKQGIEQVVLAREMSLSEIEETARKTGAKLEIFAHGALCMSYSGQCLLSSVIGGRSGNRGKCAQPCRLLYKVNDYPERGHYLSLLDLMTLRHIKKIREIGVSSLKIEGRMKGSAYVGEVVSIYRKYIDSEREPSDFDIERLNRIFFRGGLTDGYLTGGLGRKMFCFTKPDNPYKKQQNTETEPVSRIKRKGLLCKAYIKEGEKPKILVSGEDISVSYTLPEIAETAKTKGISEDEVVERLNKTGALNFDFEKTEIEIIGKPYLSASSLNKLRREAIGLYEKEFVNSFKRNNKYKEKPLEFNKKEKTESDGIIFDCRIGDFKQFEAAKKFDFDRFFVPMHIIFKHKEEFSRYRDKIIIEPPVINKNEKALDDGLDELYKMGFTSLSVNNIALFQKKKFELFGDFRLNLFNSNAIAFVGEQGLKAVEVSPELNLAQIRALCLPDTAEAIVYGRLPLMVSENCVIKNRESCPCGNENYLTDRMNVKFPVVRDGDSHRSVILNSKPIFMGDKIMDIKRCGIMRQKLYFTIENNTETENICSLYFEGRGKAPSDYTRLHYLRGVK